MIYDCFNFYNELELLEIRLNELWETVDKFILVESTTTFTNQPKPLYYFKNKYKFKKFEKKIVHVIVNDSPNVSNPWIIEHHQLASVARGLSKCDPSDTILISCVDEIPKAEEILKWKNKSGRHKAFMQVMSYYYLNCVNYNGPENGLWAGTRMFKYKDALSYSDFYIARFSPIDLKIPNGGWHFNYIGGVKKIQNKLAAFSHQEFNNDNYNTPENIKKAIETQSDFLKRGLKFKIVDEGTLPNYVLENKKKFSQWIASGISDIKFYKKLKIFFYNSLIPARKIARKLLFFRNFST